MKETINANNLRSAVLGNLFYISSSHHVYVGNGVMQKGFPFDQAEWFRIFQERKEKLMYGPLTEGCLRFQLYDLEKDICEKINVIEDYPEVAGRLRELLKQHIFNGRSTPGPRQLNNGEAVWETIRWVEETDL